MASEDLKKRLYDLSDRELQVLQLFCEDPRYHSIAKRLGIKTGGVKSHMSHIRDKLRVGTSRQITRQYCPLLKDEAVRQILVEIPRQIEEVPEPEPEAAGDATEDETPITESDTPTEVPADAMPEPEPDTALSVPADVGFGPEFQPDASDTQPIPIQKESNRWCLLWTLIGVAIGAIIVCCLITVGVFIFRDALFGTKTTPTAQVPEPQAVTVVVTATPEPVQISPTTQAATPTAQKPKESTVVVTATPTQTPRVPNSPTPVPATHTPSATATPTLPPPPTWTPSVTPLPTPLAVGGRWQEDGVALQLLEVFYRADKECVVMRYNFYNNTDHAMIVTLDINDFQVTDNLGRTWRANGLQNFNCSFIYNTISQASRSVNPGDDLGRQTLAFVGHLTDTNTDYIDVVVNMSHITNAKWRIPIDN